MNTNDYWNIFMQRTFRKNNPIIVIFIFIDYKYHIGFDYDKYLPSDDIYKVIHKYFEPNSKTQNKMDLDDSKFQMMYEETFRKKTNIEQLNEIR